MKIVVATIGSRGDVQPYINLAQGLPAEYRQLKRPKPSAPLANSGCSLVFGLFWTLFSAIFVVAGVTFPT